MEREKPQLIRAQIQREDGTIEERAVRVDEIRTSKSKKHDALTKQQRDRAKKSWAFVSAFMQPMTKDEWLNRFLYDADIDSELATWEGIERVTNIAVNEIHIPRLTIIQIAVGISMNAVDISAQAKQPDEVVDKIREIFARPRE